MTLAEQLDPERVTVTALHPATMMNTPMALGNGMQARSSVEDGANAVMQLAVDQALTGRTGLWDPSVALTRARPLAHAPVRCDRACLQKWVDDYLVAIALRLKIRDQNNDAKG